MIFSPTSTEHLDIVHRIHIVEAEDIQLSPKQLGYVFRIFDKYTLYSAPIYIYIYKNTYIIRSAAQREELHSHTHTHPNTHSHIKRTQYERRTIRYTNCYYISTRTTNKLQINIRFHFSYVITNSTITHTLTDTSNHTNYTEPVRHFNISDSNL